MLRLLAVLSVCLASSAFSNAGEAKCPSFASYATAQLKEVDDNVLLERALKPVVKIDRQIKQAELEAAFDCVLARNRQALIEAFGGQTALVDPDFYQFPDSDFAYGRVIVSKSSYQAFLEKKIQQPLTLVKLTFDFDSNGTVMDQDLFLINIAKGKAIYSEFKNGRKVVTQRCFACHESQKQYGVFFKQQYAGRRFTSKDGRALP